MKGKTNMDDRFTVSAEGALKNALEIAGSMGHSYIGTEHLLLALIANKNSVASNVLISHGVTFERTKELLASCFGSGKNCAPSASDMSPRLRRVIEMSAYSSLKSRESKIGTEHLLSAILNEPQSAGAKLIKSQGVSLSEIYGDLIGLEKNISSFEGEIIPLKAKKLPEALEKYGRELTSRENSEKLDPVIGRELETENLIKVLLRRNKNNPCLVGEAGVGKTAIAEGLASDIALGKAEGLSGKRIVALDLPAMLAGAKYRGEFEDRMKTVIAAAEDDPDIILFVDELHTIVGAGSSEGSIDAANILKPSLARGKIRMIGATTAEEYRKFIEKDPALERRFQPIYINEPTAEQTAEILKGVSEKYSRHHRLTITDEAVTAAVRLSERYIPERYFPDKAFDLLDEAAAGKRLLLRKNALNREPLNSENAEKIFPFLTAEDVSSALSSRLGIKISPEAGAGELSVAGISKKLSERVFGQEGAVSSVAKTVARGLLGLSEVNRPLGSFLFLGGPGVGKTELALAISESAFSVACEVIRLDMSEFSEPHTVSKLIGSPPGYVGYREDGILSKKMGFRSRCVIVFEDIEKAHPDISGILAGILDNGFLTDSSGKRLDFRNSVIILTSRLGADELSRRTVGFSSDSAAENEGERLAKLKFDTELVERLDTVVIFDGISPETGEMIAEKSLTELSKRLDKLGISMNFAEEMPKHIVSLASLKQGARSIIKLIREELETAILERICEGKTRLFANFDSKEGKITVSEVTNECFSHIM